MYVKILWMMIICGMSKSCYVINFLSNFVTITNMKFKAKHILSGWYQWWVLVIIIKLTVKISLIAWLCYVVGEPRCHTFMNGTFITCSERSAKYRYHNKEVLYWFIASLRLSLLLADHAKGQQATVLYKIASYIKTA